MIGAMLSQMLNSLKCNQLGARQHSKYTQHSPIYLNQEHGSTYNTV